MPEIGETLREARMRARIDVSEIEAQTKIRAKYLRALENEEWGLLPGPTYVKSFLRTYAQALGVDGKALVEEYRVNHESPNDLPLEPIGPSRRRMSMRVPGARPSRGYTIIVVAVALVIVLLIVGLVAGGGGSSKSTTSAAHSRARSHSHHARAGGAGSARPVRVGLALEPTGPVYVCLIGEGGRRLIPGIILQPGARTATYYAKRFVMTLGNSSVTMLIDGVPRAVPPSNQAIGYTITKTTGRRALQVGQLPTCA